MFRCDFDVMESLESWEDRRSLGYLNTPFHGFAQENVAAYTHRTAGGTEIEVRGRCRSAWMRYEDQKMSGWMGLPGCDCMAAVNLGLVRFGGLIPTGTNPAEARASRSLTCG